MLTKKKIEVVEIEDMGLPSMLGERVLLMCANLFYEGILEAVSDTDAILSDAGVVYDTGPWKSDNWKDRQELPGQHGVKLQAVESYCLTPQLVTP